MIAPIRIAGINLVQFNRIGGLPSNISSLLIPSIFVNISNAEDCAFVVNTIEICDFVGSQMVPSEARREEGISKLVQYAPKMMLSGSRLFVKDDDSKNKLVYMPWNGQLVKAKHTDYALDIKSAMMYLNESYKYHDIFSSGIIGNYRIPRSVLRLYLVKELNHLKKSHL